MREVLLPSMIHAINMNEIEVSCDSHPKVGVHGFDVMSKILILTEFLLTNNTFVSGDCEIMFEINSRGFWMRSSRLEHLWFHFPTHVVRILLQKFIPKSFRIFRIPVLISLEEFLGT